MFRFSLELIAEECKWINSKFVWDIILREGLGKYMDEAILIRNAKKDNVDAFNHLVLTYQEQVFNLAYRMLNDEMAAQDVTQNTFINAFQNLKSFHGGSFRAWVLRIAANNSYDELRRKKRKPSQPLTAMDTESGEEMDDPIWLEDNRNLPEEYIIKKELEEAIQRCIDQLPKNYRAVIILVDIQGFGYQEASRIAGSPIGTIRSRLARARLRVQDCLQGFRELLPEKFRLNLGSKL
jgi:RNA polymerase sigma-70 factor (ECF subfamily)